MKTSMILQKLGIRSLIRQSSQPYGQPTMVTRKMPFVHPYWTDLTSPSKSVRNHTWRHMSVNTKGSAAGGREKPKDGSDCPDDDKGIWKPKNIKIEEPETKVEESGKIEVEEAPKIETREPYQTVPSKLGTPERASKALSSTTGSPIAPPSDSLRRQKAAIDSQRATYQEKQSNYRVDFTKVKSAPGPSNEQWWYPDPYTGFYVPVDHFGKVSKGVSDKKSKSGARSKSNKGGGMGNKGWWISMEDLPESLS